MLLSCMHHGVCSPVVCAQGQNDNHRQTRLPLLRCCSPVPVRMHVSACHWLYSLMLDCSLLPFRDSHPVPFSQLAN